MPQKQHQRPERNHSVIFNAMGWVFIGTRFVSTLSSDAPAAMHFESWSGANVIAEHLRHLRISDGICVKKAKHEYGITFKFIHPMIPDAAGPSKQELSQKRVWAQRSKAVEPAQEEQHAE